MSEHQMNSCVGLFGKDGEVGCLKRALSQAQERIRELTRIVHAADTWRALMDQPRNDCWEGFEDYDVARDALAKALPDMPVPVNPVDCDHKFVDSHNCLKCGWVPPGSRPTSTGEQPK